jgi:uncharacterized protein
MANRKFEITDARGGAALGVRVVTKAEQTEIVGKNENGTLRIRLQASPAGESAANEELVSFLAQKLGVDVSKVEIVAGERSRDKIVSVEGLSTQFVEEKLIPKQPE